MLPGASYRANQGRRLDLRMAPERCRDASEERQCLVILCQGTDINTHGYRLYKERLARAVPLRYHTV